MKHHRHEPSAHKFRKVMINIALKTTTHLTLKGNEHHTQMAGDYWVKTAYQQFRKLLYYFNLFSACS